MLNLEEKKIYPLKKIVYKNTYITIKYSDFTVETDCKILGS